MDPEATIKLTTNRRTPHPASVLYSLDIQGYQLGFIC